MQGTPTRCQIHLANKSEIGKKSCSSLLHLPYPHKWLTQIHTGPSHRGGSQGFKVTKHFRKLALWVSQMVNLIIFSHLGPRLAVAHPLPPRAGMEQTQNPPQLEKDFERVIVYGHEWLQSQGSRNWNAAYEEECYYSKTHTLQTKWNFSNGLVCCSVVYLWATFPKAAYFPSLTGYRKRKQG